MSATCRVLGVARSNVHQRLHRAVDWIDRRTQWQPRTDAQLRSELRAVIAPLATYGYRRATALLNRRRRLQRQAHVNHKRVYRVMRAAGWLLARHTGRPLDTRAHEGRIAVGQSNRRWCSDGFEIGCDNAERVRVAFALDCCDREALSWLSTTAGIDGELVRDLMVEAVETRFGQAYTGTKRNLDHPNGHPHFELMRHDVTFPLYVEVDQIFNLACPASPVHYQNAPVQTTKTSVHGAINMLGLAKRVRARIFQASTSEVYGDPEVHPQPEGYWGRVNPIGVRSCYDEGKRCAETLFFDYWRQHQLAIKVGRIFNTYGSRMHASDGRVVSNFIVQALRNDPITVYGDGSQTRSFCYVDDLIEAILRLMDTPDDVTGPINLGNGQEFTVGQLANLVIELTDSRSQVIYKPIPSDDPRQRKPDTSLAERVLAWNATTPLATGLQRTIAYFDGLLREQPDPA